jgi:hypothetical protein
MPTPSTVMVRGRGDPGRRHGQAEGRQDSRSSTTTSPFGREPIPFLETLARGRHGFELQLLPIAAPGLEQRSAWLAGAGRCARTTYFLWGWGRDELGVALREAVGIGYPREQRCSACGGRGPSRTVAADAKGAKGYRRHHPPAQRGARARCTMTC